MTTAKNLALSVALASYARPETAPEGTVLSVQRLVQVDRPKKGRAISAKASTVKPVVAAEPTVESAPQPTNPSPNGKVVGIALPAAGTIGAKAFIMMMNRAKSLDEKRVAIAAFIGYDGRLTFAEQELTANAKAKAEISPVKVTGPSREEIRTAQRSAVGYVAGMPDALKRTVQDLVGRENLAVDERNRHVREARDNTRSWADRKLSIGLARLEQERLTQIRADLARFV